MKEFEIKTQFTFEGIFKVKAENKHEAIENVVKHCGLVLGSIHSTLCKETIDWEFETHPNKVIKSVKQKKTKQK